MRLIDADKLEAYGTTVPKECNAEDYISGVRDVLEHIDSMPTVDAIPIAWIENFIDDIGDLEDEMTMRTVYSLLINEWRKEND